MIPSRLYTPTGIFKINQFPLPYKNSKNPDLPIFSGELLTPKGEAEYGNYIFQLKLLRSSYMDDAIRNAIMATVSSHVKIAIRAIGYNSSSDTMPTQLENIYGLGETIDTLFLEFHQLMQPPKENVSEERVYTKVLSLTGKMISN